METASNAWFPLLVVTALLLARGTDWFPRLLLLSSDLVAMLFGKMGVASPHVLGFLAGLAKLALGFAVSALVSLPAVIAFAVWIEARRARD
jgi:hypothetical protein